MNKTPIWSGADSSHLALFPLERCWETPFKELSTCFRKLVTRRSLQPRELATIAKLAYAINRLPLVTRGVSVEADLTCRQPRGDTWLGIQVYNGSLSIYSGETVPGVSGPESVTHSLINVEVGCGHDREDSDPDDVLYELENWVRDWISMAGDNEYVFTIKDDSGDFDWNQPIAKNGWGALENGA